MMGKFLPGMLILGLVVARFDLVETTEVAGKALPERVALGLGPTDVCEEAVKGVSA